MIEFYDETHEFRMICTKINQDIGIYKQIHPKTSDAGYPTFLFKYLRFDLMHFDFTKPLAIGLKVRLNRKDWNEDRSIVKTNELEAIRLDKYIQLYPEPEYESKPKAQPVFFGASNVSSVQAVPDVKSNDDSGEQYDNDSSEEYTEDVVGKRPGWIEPGVWKNRNNPIDYAD